MLTVDDVDVVEDPELLSEAVRAAVLLFFVDVGDGVKERDLCVASWLVDIDDDEEADGVTDGDTSRVFFELEKLPDNDEVTELDIVCVADRPWGLSEGVTEFEFV